MQVSCFWMTDEYNDYLTLEYYIKLLMLVLLSRKPNLTMKKIFCYLVLLFSLFTYSQQTYIPDSNFEQALIDLGYDTTLDNYVITANISSVINLDVSSKNISSLKGIEGFEELKTLKCNSNSLTNLDVSKNNTLEELQCLGNGLTSITFPNNSSIENLECSNNSLVTLDTNNLNNLMYLNCSSNNITSLILDKASKLEYVYCENNTLTSLSIKNGTNSFNIPFSGQFDARNNPNLVCTQVDDASFSTTHWANIDSETSFNEDCNYKLSNQHIQKKNLTFTINHSKIYYDGIVNVYNFVGKKVPNKNLQGLYILELQDELGNIMIQKIIVP